MYALLNHKWKTFDFMFELHPTLAADTFIAGDLPLCRVLLMNDSSYPWLILVPKVPNMVEITDLPETEQHFLMAEITAASRMLQQSTGADKMNVAALGNMVNQLHVHVVARFKGDAAWPAPVWGKNPAIPYSLPAAEEVLALVRKRLALSVVS